MKRLSALLALLRPRQWIKNGFVLAPLVFSGKFHEPACIVAAVGATLLFCLASSASYVVNDMLDIEQDKRHPRKALSRPLAAGTVSVHSALALLVVLYAAVALGIYLKPAMLLTILGYVALNLAYSFVLKHQPLLDIFSIALGFVLRIYAGAAAIDVPVSSWMFITTLMLALYLAAVKRRQELKQGDPATRKVLENYSVALVDRYAEMSATGALVFYSLFVMSVRPQLMITVPLVLFGLFRYWYVVEKRDGGESPTDALLTDWQLLVTVLLWVAVCVWVLWALPG
ncbi:MAG TPA: decaprenyl-phosphate phosphoribosyltransferase [Candidatus Acidoferrum sp.]|nr:decaprenyl-phosphate phosphoribosyltransferase [Candidatus Acidoferrum sp.]